MSLGYETLDGVLGGCRLTGGDHGEVNVDFLRSPGDSNDDLDSCKAYCDADSSCLAIEWESPEGRYGPKCEIWRTMPDYTEAKAHHQCMYKLRPVPPSPGQPPSSPPPPPPDAPPSSDAGLIIGAAVGGGVAALALLVIVILLVRRRTNAKA